MESCTALLKTRDLTPQLAMDAQRIGTLTRAQALIERIPGMVADLIEENRSPEGTDASEVTVEIIVCARLRVPDTA
jgi:hypothetical protein